MLITAIDPGILGTGYASYNPASHVIEYGQVRTPKALGDKYVRSMKQLSILHPRIDNSSVIAIEDYNAYRYGGAAANTLVLIGILYQYCVLRHDIHILNNRHWASVFKALSVTLPKRLREHEKDAIGQLFCVCHDIGQPIDTNNLRYSKRS